MTQIAHSPFILNEKFSADQITSRNNSPVFNTAEVRTKNSNPRHRRTQSNLQGEFPSILNSGKIFSDKEIQNSSIFNLKRTEAKPKLILSPESTMMKCSSGVDIRVTPVLSKRSKFDFLSETKKSLQNLGKAFFAKSPAVSRNNSIEKEETPNKTLKRTPSMKEKEFQQSLKAVTPQKNQKPDLHLDLSKILNDNKHILCKDNKNIFTRAVHEHLPEIQIDLTKPSPIASSKASIKNRKIDLNACQPVFIKQQKPAEPENLEDPEPNYDEMWKKVREQDYMMNEEEFFKKFLETDKLDFSFEKQMTMKRANMFNPVATPEPQSKGFAKNQHKLSVGVDFTYHSNANSLSTAHSSTKGSSKSSISLKSNEISKDNLRNVSRAKCIQEEPERPSFSSGSKSPCPSSKKVSHQQKLNLKIGFDDNLKNIVQVATKGQSKNEKPAKFFF